MSTDTPQTSIAANQPDASASVQVWVDWFYQSFLPAWIEHARDPNGFGFYDLLDQNAQPLQRNRRTVLAQARLLFTFSHLALLTKNPVFIEAARVARDALPVFQKSPGCYARARSNTRQQTEVTEDNLAMSYDQSFVILGLSTWGKLNAGVNSLGETDAELEACWTALENNFTDNLTGLLLEYDNLADPAHPDAPMRAQNPHMHLFEAALQAYEMTKHPVWLERARLMRSKGLEYFYDRTTGTLIEFIAPDLSALAGRDGLRREIGHQCEWAWLLYREAELGGDSSHIDIANSLLAFADKHGFQKNGAMQGAAFDAVAADNSFFEDKYLLWPQTEAIKTYAIRKDQANHADNARQLMLLVFQRYFANRAAFVNQLDSAGKTLWSEALSRLLYHLVLALTEGARAKLWETPA